MESGSKIVSANVSTAPYYELAASSSQISLPGCSSIAASSFQKSLPDSSVMEVNTDMNGTSSVATYEFAASSSQNSLPGCSSLVCLREEDIPGASLNGHEPSQLYVL